MFDDGMKPHMREALVRLQQDQARQEARAKARAARPAPPDGHEYLDVAVADLSVRLQHDVQAAAEARVDIEGAIRAGDLLATSARKKLPIRPGTKFDPDDCLVTMPALFAWARVNEAQSADTPAGLDVVACTGAPTPAPASAELAPAKRGDTLTSVIERACLQVSWPWRTADVWNVLRSWAESKEPTPPLVEPKGGVIIYEDYEDNSELTKDQLSKRLSRMRIRRRASL